MDEASYLNVTGNIDKNIICTQFGMDDSFRMDIFQSFDYPLQNMGHGISSKQSDLLSVRVFSPPSHYSIQLRVYLLESSVVWFPFFELQSDFYVASDGDVGGEKHSYVLSMAEFPEQSHNILLNPQLLQHSDFPQGIRDCILICQFSNIQSVLEFIGWLLFYQIRSFDDSSINIENSVQYSQWNIMTDPYESVSAKRWLQLI